MWFAWFSFVSLQRQCLCYANQNPIGLKSENVSSNFPPIFELIDSGNLNYVANPSKHNIVVKLLFDFHVFIYPSVSRFMIVPDVE